MWKIKNRHNKTSPDRYFPIDSVKVGKETYGGLDVLIHGVGYKLVIGNYCSIAPRVSFILCSDHAVTHISTFPFKNKILDNEQEAISKGDIIIGDDVWMNTFTKKPEAFTRDSQKAYLANVKGVVLGSDAFFPFGDNIERAHRSGVSYVVEPGGSVRDDNVIATCDKYDMVMCFTGMRLFHH